MATLSTGRKCPYCASSIELGDCPIVATSYKGGEFRGAEELELDEVELFSGARPTRLLRKTGWPVLSEAPREVQAEALVGQQGRSRFEQAFAGFSDSGADRAELPPLLGNGISREDVPARACWECEFPLPQSIDHRPAIVVAVVGVNRVGKTHFLATSLTAAYRHQGLGPIGCTEFVPDDSTGKRFMEDYYYPLFRRGTILEPTQAENEEVRFQPLVFNVTLRDGNPFSLVMHDVAGEVLGERDLRARNATFLHGAQGIIFVVDPRDIDDLRDSLPASMWDEEDLGWDQGSLLSTCLSPDGLPARPDPIPIAIAIAKADQLPHATGEPLSFLTPAPDGEAEDEFYQRLRSTSRAVQDFLEAQRAHNILGPARGYERQLEEVGAHPTVTYHAFSALGGSRQDIEQAGAKVRPINALDPLAAILSQL